MFETKTTLAKTRRKTFGKNWGGPNCQERIEFLQVPKYCTGPEDNRKQQPNGGGTNHISVIGIRKKGKQQIERSDEE
jgi:hypothetical protein